MIDLRNHYGFTRTPFGKDLAPSMLCHYPAHAEAVARITWCARERAVGVITGEVGAGKTVAARAAIAGLDQTRHTLIYLADPTTGTRGIHHQVVTALGGRPAHGTATLAAQAAALLAAETRRARPGPGPGNRLFRPAPLVSATSGEPPSGRVTALLTCRVRDVRYVPGIWGIRGAQGCHRGSSRAGGRAGRPRPVVHDRVAGRGGAPGGGPVPAGL